MQDWSANLHSCLYLLKLSQCLCELLQYLASQLSCPSCLEASEGRSYKIDAKYRKLSSRERKKQVQAK